MLVPVSNIDLLAQLAVASVPSLQSKAAYTRRLREFLTWHTGEGSPVLNRATVKAYSQFLQDKGLAPATVNQSLSAVKALVREAVDAGLMEEMQGASIQQVRGVPKRGESCGRWLTEDQARLMIASPDRSTPIGRRDYALMGLLFGCGLRRFEAVRVTPAMIQQREGRWVIVDLTRKRGKIHTVPVPEWAYAAVSQWVTEAGISEGPILRGFTLNGVMTDSLSASQVHRIVQHYAAANGLELSPHDVRRTAITILMSHGATMEQLRQFAGHDSIQTTERYLQRVTSIKNAACDLVDLSASS